MALQLRDIPTWMLWRTGLARLARAILVSGGRFVLVFHGISTHRYLDLPQNIQPSLSKAELECVLAWLQNAGFSFLTPEEFLVTEKPGVLLTFDDGLASHYTNALPVLEAFNAPALYFITTQHVQDTRDWLPATHRMARQFWKEEGNVPAVLAADFYDGLTSEQLAACGQHRLITIGAHTVSHPFLTRCYAAQVHYELVEARRFLQTTSGQAVDLLAYPTGDYNRSVAEAVQSCGYRAAFALDPHPVGLPAFEIPRIGIYGAGESYLGAKLSGLHRSPLRHAPLHDIR